MLDGEPVAREEWIEVAEYARQSFPASAPHFHELHCVMAFAAAGQWDLYERRLADLRDRHARGVLPPGAVVPALAEGFGAFLRGDYATAARVMEPVAQDIVRVGGSHAQQDVFDETLIAAWLHSGEARRAACSLRARLDRRPSPRAERWLARALAG
jgi:hypothetical protein